MLQDVQAAIREVHRMLSNISVLGKDSKTFGDALEILGLMHNKLAEAESKEKGEQKEAECQKSSA